jgi:UDP-N-acetylglucosamine 2-epimerase (non-hydrolysing)
MREVWQFLSRQSSKSQALFQMNITHIVGARPNFMKAAPVIEALSQEPGIRQTLVHTGQHYDASMSQVFFDQLGMPRPDFNLEVGSGSHARQTAEIMSRFEEVVLKNRPDLLVVYGDVNSTIATALVATKMGIPVAHVEAGLRSGDRTMPEEINRILVDAIAEILFVSEPSGEANLLREGIGRGKIHFVGNSMIDTLLKHREQAEKTSILEQLHLLEQQPGEARDRAIPYSKPVQEFILLTLHRPSNVDSREGLTPILEAVQNIAQKRLVLFPCHPRTRQRINEFGLAHCFANDENGSPVLSNGSTIVCTAPLGYLDFVHLMSKSKLVLTDSGGVQEETTVLNVPCLTLRNNTERPATISHGTNILAGNSRESIIAAHKELMANHRAITTPPLWDGKAGQRIAKVLASYRPN